MPKEMIKISFGAKPKDEMPEGASSDMASEEMGEENHVAILTEIKAKVQKIPGTEKIVQAIDEFLASKGEGSSEPEIEGKEDQIFKSFSDYFSNKMSGKK